MSQEFKGIYVEDNNKFMPLSNYFPAERKADRL